MMGQSNTSSRKSVEKRSASLRKEVKRLSSTVNRKVDGKTQLFNAIKENNYDAARVLLENGADSNITCSISRADGYRFLWTAIHEACRQNNVPCLEELLAYGGNVNLRAHEELSPLHVAAWHGHREAAKILIEAGCDVNQLDRFEESALVIPICNGDREMVESLLQAGCRLNSRAWGKLSVRSWQCLKVLNAVEGPFSLLSLAIMYGNFDVACLLVQHGYGSCRLELYVLLKMLHSSTGQIDSGEGRRLIECYLAGACNQRGGLIDSAMLDNLLLPPNQGFEKVTLDWIKGLLRTPPPLKGLARTTIRASLQDNYTSIQNRLEKLPLPSQLKKYLCLEECVGLGRMQPCFALAQRCVCCLEQFDNLFN